MWPAALSLAVLLLLAGCSDPPAPPEGPTSPTEGAIQGVVVSEGIVPIGGASVQLMSGEEVFTDTDGAFLFEALEPGLYTMKIQATGYLAIQATADVAAGKVAKPRVVLPIDSSPQPYHLTTAFDGYVELADGWVTWILMDFTGNTDFCTCEFEFPVTTGAEELVLEGFWDPSSPVNDDEFWWEIFDTNGTYDDAGYSGSPLWERHPVESWAPGDGLIRFAVGTTIQFQQDYQAFATVFYNAPAPADWSIAS